MWPRVMMDARACIKNSSRYTHKSEIRDETRDEKEERSSSIVQIINWSRLNFQSGEPAGRSLSSPLQTIFMRQFRNFYPFIINFRHSQDQYQRF